MTQKEFEDRIGRKATQEEYVKADAAYLAAGNDMDKDTFCKLYVDEGGLHDLVNILADRVRKLQGGLDACLQDAHDAYVKLLDVSENIRAGIASAASLDTFIRRQLGDKEYLRAKLADKGLTPTDADREMLTSLL